MRAVDFLFFVAAQQAQNNLHEVIREAAQPTAPVAVPTPRVRKPRQRSYVMTFRDVVTIMLIFALAIAMFVGVAVAVASGGS
jgi:SHS2 domain-containing protein